MENKGFAEQQTKVMTPDSFVIAEKPLKNQKNISKRVDINILKSKLTRVLPVLFTLLKCVYVFHGL